MSCTPVGTCSTVNEPPKSQACQAPPCANEPTECRDKVFIICSLEKDRIVIFRRFSVMYQPLENIVTQISFEVYAVRVAPKCKSKFIICSLDLSRQKWQNIDVTSLVIRIKIELNSFEKLKNREKGKTRHNLIIKGDGIKMLNSLAPPLQRAYSSLAALESSISNYHHPFIRNILRHKYTLVILITIDES